MVSGFATLIGFTVSYRSSLPGLPAPYVVAQVAIEEDPRVRLTTNAVECDPEQLQLGMRMEVVFEQARDVWLPLASPDKFEDKVAITGIGSSELGRRLMIPPLALTAQAWERAVADAGLTMDDIDGLSTYPGAGMAGPFGEGGVTALEAALGIRPTWYNGGGETLPTRGRVRRCGP